MVHSLYNNIHVNILQQYNNIDVESYKSSITTQSHLATDWINKSVNNNNIKDLLMCDLYQYL